jgi:transposase
LKADEQGRADVMAERAEFVKEMSGLRAEDLVAVDETGITTDMVRTYARSAPGERAYGSAPHGRWKKLTVLGGIALGREPVLMSIEAATDTDVFLAFVREVLVPSLRPGQIVLMDNLSPHKAPQVREAIEAAQCKLRLLPRYSPEFNPIEMCWSKIKALLRKVEARTTEALNAALTDALDQIALEDIRGWFTHAGYKVAPQ